VCTQFVAYPYGAFFRYRFRDLQGEREPAVASKSRFMKGEYSRLAANQVSLVFAARSESN